MTWPPTVDATKLLDEKGPVQVGCLERGKAMRGPHTALRHSKGGDPRQDPERGWVQESQGEGPTWVGPRTVAPYLPRSLVKARSS